MPISSVAMLRCAVALSRRQNRHSSQAAAAVHLVCQATTDVAFTRRTFVVPSSSGETTSPSTTDSLATDHPSSTTCSSPPPKITPVVTLSTSPSLSPPKIPPKADSRPKASNRLDPFHLQFMEQSHRRYDRRQYRQRRKNDRQQQQHMKSPSSNHYDNNHHHHSRHYNPSAPNYQQQQQQGKRPSNNKNYRHNPPRYPNRGHNNPKFNDSFQRQQQQQYRRQERQHQQQPQESDLPDDLFPQSSYIEVKNIPILSSLDDIVRTVNDVLDIEKERGIVDLDTLVEQLATSTPSELPLLKFDDDEEEEEDDVYINYNEEQKEEVEHPSKAQQEEQRRWIVSARTILSTKYRPTGWKLQFANRSVVHALLTHAKETQLYCAWKPIEVLEWKKPATRTTHGYKQKEGHHHGHHSTDIPTNINHKLPRDAPPRPSSDSIQVSDSMVRIENCPKGMTVDHIRHVLRRYDLSLKDTPSIIKLSERTGGGDSFLVKFEDPTWARAAMRELQGIQLQDNNDLRFCQYPKQIV